MSKKFGSDTFELFFTDLIFSHWSSINKGTDFNIRSMGPVKNKSKQRL